MLAAEPGISYAFDATVTDYDCLRDPGKVVHLDAVLEAMNNNVNSAKSFVVKAVEMLAKIQWSKTVKANEAKAKSSIMH